MCICDLMTEYQEILKYNFVLSQSHISTCEFLKLPCVHAECGVLVKKADITRHLKEECTYRLEKCSFCQQQINLNKMKVNYLQILFK